MYYAENIPLRGYRDDARYFDTDYNCGDFQSLLQFKADSGVTVLKEHFKNMKQNANYRSKTILKK